MTQGKHIGSNNPSELVFAGIFQGFHNSWLLLKISSAQFLHFPPWQAAATVSQRSSVWSLFSSRLCLNCFLFRMGTEYLTGTCTHLAVHHVREFVCPCAYFLLSCSVMGNTLTSQMQLNPLPVTHSHSAILGADCRLSGKAPSSFVDCWKYLAFNQYL